MNTQSSFISLQGLAEDSGAGEALTVADALNALCARVERQADGKAPCVPSGLAGLDKLLGGGYINGGLHIVGARPAVGKSALALQIALNAAKSGVKVVYASLEMSSEDCSARLVGNLGGGSAARFMFGGQLSEEEYRRFASGMSQLSKLPIVFNRRSGMNVRQIEALCFREKPGLLVIDHLGLLEPPEKRLVCLALVELSSGDREIHAMGLTNCEIIEDLSEAGAILMNE